MYTFRQNIVRPAAKSKRPPRGPGLQLGFRPTSSPVRVSEQTSSAATDAEASPRPERAELRVTQFDDHA
jgi:hypothetical protein